MCKITVLKKMINKDLIEEYCQNSKASGCQRFTEGQEFIVESIGEKPSGFCAWAWDDIYKCILTLMSGGDFRWMKEKGTIITCCSDGLMPVVFRIERMQI